MLVTDAGAISIDCDDAWAYLRGYGDADWRSRPSFLDTAIPRIIDVFSKFDIQATAFIVASDLENPVSLKAISRLKDAGFEIGNHSWEHAPDFHRYTRDQLDIDFARSDKAFFKYLGDKPVGFRAPSFGFSRAIAECIAGNDYRYDASLFPSSLGWLSHRWHRLNRRVANAGEQLAEPQWRPGDMCHPLKPFEWELDGKRLLEIPVSTMPWIRLPVHTTYLHLLNRGPNVLSRGYMAIHRDLSKLTKSPPSLLLHALDFIGQEDRACPSFIPGATQPLHNKLELVEDVLLSYTRRWKLLPIGPFLSSYIADKNPIRTRTL